jgi:hypothetical protein
MAEGTRGSKVKDIYNALHGVMGGLQEMDT